MLKFDRRSIALLAVAASAATAFATGAHAETDRISDGILITGNLEPLPTKEVTSSYTIITRDDIERHQYRTLTEALRGVPGMHIVQQGGRGSVSSVFTRGTNSNETLVLLNGNPINDPSSPTGAFDFSTIVLNDVDRIEVVRGPQSALYGTQAIGGVINIITRQGGGTPASRLQVEGGTLGTLNLSASSSGSVGGTDYSFAASRHATKGNDITPSRLRRGAPEEKDSTTHSLVSGQITSQLTDQVTGSLFGRFIDINNETDSDQPGGIGSEGQAYELFASGSLKGKFDKGRWFPELAVSYARYHRNNHNSPDRFSATENNDNNLGSRIAVRQDNSYRVLDWNTLGFGATYAYEEFSANGRRYIPPSPPFSAYVSTPASDANTSSVAVYGSDHVTIGDSFFMTVSGDRKSVV